MAKLYLSTSVNRPLGSAAYQERASFPSNLKDWDRIFKQCFILSHSVKNTIHDKYCRASWKGPEVNGN
jgi:hypothetical protein